MIIRTVKLKLTKIQEAMLVQWLWHLTGLWNFAVKKIEHDASDKVYYSRFDCRNWVANHSKNMGIPSHVMQGILTQAHVAWQRCFQKLAKKPRLKGQRNKLNSIPFPDPIRPPKCNHVSLPGLGKVRYYKQDFPQAKIMCGRIVKRASGWYLCLWFDCDHKFPVQNTDNAVGIDPGFKTLLTLSDGSKFDNPRELHKGALRFAQAQRGNRKHLAARLQERQANRRKDRNHKISRKLVEQYATICYSQDNFQKMSKRFGKSVSEASLSNLIRMIEYKGRTGGRKIVPVNSRYTTMTCGQCGALTGPTGLRGLAVRQWECSACGAVLDRDINAAQVVLKTGLGISHKREARNVA